MITLFHTFSESQLNERAFRTLLSYLPETDQERISRYRRWQDKQSHLIGRLLLLCGLVERGLPASSLEAVKTTGYGKPFIAGDIEFNISHSETCVACAVTDSGRIGVDVEAVGKTDISFYKEYMNDAEWDEIQQSTYKQEAFFDFWTKKEAVIKADGRGLNVPLNQIHLSKKTAALSGKEWSLLKVGLRRPYICHLAFDRSISGLIMKEVDLKEHSNNRTRIYTETADQQQYSRGMRADKRVLSSFSQLSATSYHLTCV